MKVMAAFSFLYKTGLRFVLETELFHVLFSNERADMHLTPNWIFEKAPCHLAVNCWMSVSSVSMKLEFLATDLNKSNVTT